MLLTFQKFLNPDLLINFFFVNFLEFFLLGIITYSFWGLFSTLFFRKKFLFFLELLGALAMLGFYYSWDGWVCIMLLVELLVILLFLLVWLTFRFSEDIQSVISIFKYPFFGIILLSYLTILTQNYSSFIYNYQLLYWFKASTVSSDFHVVFKFFFLDYPLTVVFITLLLSLISIFFIGLYYSLKKVQGSTQKKKKLLHILRKQQMTKQANFKAQIRMFQVFGYRRKPIKLFARRGMIRPAQVNSYK